MKALIEYTQTRYPSTKLGYGESGRQISEKIVTDGKQYNALYRGVPSNWDFLDSLKEGDEIRVSNKMGFTSTSRGQSIAEQFAFDDDSEIQVIFEIRDAHGLDVSEMSKWDEKEVLLDRKQVFNVIKIERLRSTLFKVIVK